jgi:RNA polymerase sigma-70 factor (ECF subfamily)
VENRAANERLTVLWVKAQPVVWAYIHSVVRDHHDAEDMLQQVAQQSAISFGQYDIDRSFTAWAIGIAKYKVREYCRNKSRDKLQLSEQAVELLADRFEQESEILATFRAALAWCLDRLDDKAREVLGLRYRENLKPAAIAERCQSNPNAMRLRLHRYRTLLGDCVMRRTAQEDRR